MTNLLGTITFLLWNWNTTCCNNSCILFTIYRIFCMVLWARFGRYKMVLTHILIAQKIQFGTFKKVLSTFFMIYMLPAPAKVFWKINDQLFVSGKELLFIKCEELLFLPHNCSCCKVHRTTCILILFFVSHQMHY